MAGEDTRQVSRWGPVLTAMVTPFDGELRLDLRRARELAERLVETGSTGIVVAGSTGESATLSEREKLHLFEAVLEAVGDRATVIANTGGNDTAASAAFTRRAGAVGAHGVMLVCPYYNKPPQEGLYRHFRTVAEATSLPVMIYNVPGRTGVNLLPDTMGRLARDVPNIAALKDAAGSPDQTTETLRALPAGFAVYSGDDSLTLPALALGACGVVSVASHLVGREIAAMIRAHQRGEVEVAAGAHRALFPLLKALFVTTNPIPVKAALRLAGFDVGDARPPLGPPAEGELAKIRDAMAACGLL